MPVTEPAYPSLHSERRQHTANCDLLADLCTAALRTVLARSLGLSYDFI